MENLLHHAIDCMQIKKVTYGEIRIGVYRNQNLSARNAIPGSISDAESIGFGIRILMKDGWGFASDPRINKKSIENAIEMAIDISTASQSGNGHSMRFAAEKSHVLAWSTEHEIDPFEISLHEKIDLLLTITNDLRKRSNIRQALAYMELAREKKLFMNTEGSFTDQTTIRINAGYTAIAVGTHGFESRSYHMTPVNAGYERIQDEPLIESIPRIAEEASMKLFAKECPHEETDLILLPSHTALTIHETIGHATELDRVMGWEADMAGTSFATIDKLNKLQYAAPIVNVIGDRIQKHGRASTPVDDEGVETSRWHIIRNGILTGYATTRATAHYIGEERSNGCCYADSWNSIPILRMPNVSIEAGGDGSPNLSDLVADTKDGVLVDGLGSFSIDHQRINFQFGGDLAWKVKNGKIVEPLKKFTYQSYNPIFWNSVDMICNQSEWRQFGVVSCGKGQPMQVAQMTHGSAPLRVRNITVGKARI